MKKFLDDWVIPLLDIITLGFSLVLAMYFLIFGNQLASVIASVALLVALINRLRLKYEIERRIRNIEYHLCEEEE